jgi:subtilisin family serine protease
VRRIALGALLALTLGLAAQAAALRSSGASGAADLVAAKVGAPVSTSLARQPWARVIVALRWSGRSLAAAGLGERRVAALQRSVLARLSRSDFQETAVWREIPGFAGRVSRSGVAKLAADPRVVRVDLDSGGHGDDNESLPLIRGDVVHGQGYLGAGQTVAILDSGIDRANVDLAGAIVAEHCFLSRGCPNGQAEQDGPGSAQDDNGHGTNVAGIIASTGTIAPVGVAPAAKLVVVKVLDRNEVFQTSSQVISALDWVIANHPEVRVVNMSLGTNALFPDTCDSSSALTLSFASAVNTLRTRGALVVASSGNDGAKSAMEAPACIASAVSVGAVYDADVGVQAIFSCVDQSSAPDLVPCFSDSSPALDLLAPGDVITSTGLGGGLSKYVGTSQAAPQVAGAAALLFSALPTATADAVESALESTGVKITDGANGRVTPRIDIAAALAALTGAPPPPPPPAPPAPPPPAPPPPTKPPHVRAVASTGRLGGIAQLRFVASSTNGEVRFRLTVRSGPRVISLFATAFRKTNGTRQSVAWRAPRTAPEKLRFCVKGTDQAKRTSKESCAPLTLSR